MLRNEIIIFPAIVCISLLYCLAFAADSCLKGTAVIPAEGADWTLPTEMMTCKNPADGADAADKSTLCMTTDSADGKNTTFACGPYSVSQKADNDAATEVEKNTTCTMAKINVCYCDIATAENCNPWKKNTYVEAGAGTMSHVTGVAMTLLVLTTSRMI